MEDEEAKKELLENAAKKIKLDAAGGGSSENAETLSNVEESIPIDETSTLPVLVVNESLVVPDNVTDILSTTDALEDS